MKGLSSLERIILESFNKKALSFDEVLFQTGLQENVCFNVLQALIIRGFISTDGLRYRTSEYISPILMSEINSSESKHAESLELMEAVVERSETDTFRFQKIAMDERDEKIFLAMLSNLESFLNDSHKKSKATTPLKDRKIIFWGMGNVKSLMAHIVTGK